MAEKPRTLQGGDNMIEIKMSGLCEDCDKADLRIDCTEVSSGLETMKYWVIKCIHDGACERMFNQMKREVTE